MAETMGVPDGEWVIILGVSISAALKKAALEIGFDLVGVAPIAAWKDLEFSRAWVERGFGGEMRYLANPKRLDPRSLLPSAQSVVCVGLVYNAPLPYSVEVRSHESEVRSGKPQETSVSSFEFPVSDTPVPRAWISRYAWGRDYHAVMRSELEKLRFALETLVPGVETRVYVDTGPIVERAFARLSGIGWMGKNTCLINERKGSWFFLGVVLTNLALEPDLAAPDRCGSCTACLEACPAGALTESYVMDASRCIAYLNIELKGSIPEEFRPAMGSNVFGCDICQDVCPWNGGGRMPKPEVRSEEAEGPSIPRARNAVRSAATTALPEFQPLTIVLRSDADLPDSASRPAPLPGGEGVPPGGTGEGLRRGTDLSSDSLLPTPDSRFFSLFNPPLETLVSMTAEEFRETFRHSPIRRVKYRGWLRNLCVAMGNSRDTRFLPKLNELSHNPDPSVREHAAWALRELTGNQPTRESPR